MCRHSQWFGEYLSSRTREALVHPGNIGRGAVLDIGPEDPLPVEEGVVLDLLINDPVLEVPFWRWRYLEVVLLVSVLIDQTFDDFLELLVVVLDGAPHGHVPDLLDKGPALVEIGLPGGLVVDGHLGVEALHGPLVLELHIEDGQSFVDDLPLVLVEV